MARPSKTHDNHAVTEHLGDYWSLSYFKDFGDAKDVWALDDILTGVSRLDFGGNTRPLRLPMLFGLLSTLPVITSDAIKEILGGSESHARRLASALRIASRAFADHISPSLLQSENYAHLYKRKHEDPQGELL